MPDREKVMKGLECCGNPFCPTENCPYDYDPEGNCADRLMREALALLKEDYRSWLMDMFHKYERDDLAAFLVQYGEEDLLATVLKEAERSSDTVDD